ncbi:hypothetical protein CAPTEDRAFT_189440 [Capitella teleta]|uniref:Uncharacterized protein n=1 Tax=Capitella teleta TaxID=283909 RepID=R7VGZ6_CAPTE|nr:hypothetical protein CAPTEDRAFT_189440 [Capitella teleta]|eukprot:ELU15576.1 hypothetical protein CAPTEDRAFT_189440 [Capitella teleta]
MAYVSSDHISHLQRILLHWICMRRSEMMTNQLDEKQRVYLGNRLRSRSVEERNYLRKRAFSQNLKQTHSFDEEPDRSVTHESTSGSEQTMSLSSRIQTNRASYRLSSHTPQTKPRCLQSRRMDYSITRKTVPTKRYSSHTCVLPDITPQSQNFQNKLAPEPEALLELEKVPDIDRVERFSVEKCRDWVSTLPDKFSGLHTVITIPAASPGYGDSTT